MKTRKTISKILALAALVAAVGVATLWTSWDSAQATVSRQSRADSGLVGISLGQAVRYNIVNTGEERGIIIVGGKFTDSDGNTLAEFPGGTLALGQGMTFELNRAAIMRTGNRVEVNAAVMFSGHPDSLLGSTQVFNIETGQSVMGWSNHNETLVSDDPVR
jgi:hypothetical protein